MATSPFAAPLFGPLLQLFDDNGNPLNAGTIRVDQAGTTTLDTIYPTYADALAGTNPLSNPFTLDSAGRGQVWVQAGRFYKVTVKTSAGVTVTGSPADFVNPAQGYPQPALDQWVISTAPPVFSSTVLLTLAGDWTAIFVKGRRFKATQTSGTIYGTVADITFAAGTSTLRGVVDGGGVFDSGLSAIWYGLVTSTYQGTAPSAVGDRQTWVRANRGANQALTLAIWNKIVFDTESRDNLSEWDTVNSRFTPVMQSSSSYNKRWRIRGQVTFDTSIVSGQIGVSLNGTTPPDLTIEAENLGIAGAVLKFDYTFEQNSLTGQFLEIYVNPIANVNVRGGASATWIQIDSLPN